MGGPNQATADTAQSGFNAANELIFQGAPDYSGGQPAPGTAGALTDAERAAIQQQLTFQDPSTFKDGSGRIAIGVPDLQNYVKSAQDTITGLLNNPDPRVQAYARQLIATGAVRNPFEGAQFAGRDQGQAGLAQSFNDFLAQTTKSVQESTPRSPSLAQGAIDRARTPADELDPLSNPYLRAYGEAGGAFLNGTAANQYGRQGAEAAGNAIGSAGQQGLDQAGQSYGALMGQAGQFGQDLGIIRGSAQGTGPSAAAILGQKLNDDAQRGMLAQAATARGGNVAAAQRQAILGCQQTMLQGAQQIAAQRAQEQLAAQQALVTGNAYLGNTLAQAGNVANTAAQTDVTRATQRAGALNSTYGQTAQLGAAGLDAAGNLSDDYQAGVLAKEEAEGQRYRDAFGLLGSTYGTAAGAATGVYNADTGRATNSDSIAAQARENARSRGWQLANTVVGGGLGALGGIGSTLVKNGSS